jgi:cytochrome c oxidase subunit 2
MVGIFAIAGQDFWMPEAASTYAQSVDDMFMGIFYLSAFSFVLIGGLMFYFVIRYRRRHPDDKPQGKSHNTTMEITWTIIPLIIVLWIFVLGFRGFMNMSTPPGDSYEVVATAWTWAWEFTYPNGATDNVLHVPADRPIVMLLESRDFLHSFFVPEFRIKKDIVPKRYNKTWFEVASEPNNITEGNPGVYNLYCAEYCGRDHSNMRTKVIVHTPEEFDRWLADISDKGKNMTLVDYGAYLYQSKSCVQCHTLDGSSSVGPSFKNQFGYAPFTLESGGQPTVDEEFLRKGIKEPNSHGIKGFTAQMPSIPLKHNDVRALITFIKSQSDKYTLTPSETEVGGTAKEDSEEQETPEK